jgi:outer membrane autotransporter protein
MPTCAQDEKPAKSDRTSPNEQIAAPLLLSQVAILVVVFASGYIPYPAHAQLIVAQGDVNPAVPSPPPAVWNIGGTLFVGQTGNGTLTITDAATVRDTNGFIGQESGSTGIVNVSGRGSTWTNVGNISAGNFGTGTVNITEGGNAASRGGAIGDNTGSVGFVTVSGVGSLWTNSRDLFVATSGRGTLVIEDGARVSSDSSFIGVDTAGNGHVTVTGPDATWANTTQLSVGFVGTGTLNILDGGAVSSSATNVGDFDTGTGSVLISGTGSSLISNGASIVGNGGAGTLTLSDEGVLSAQNGTGTVGLAMFAGATGTLNLGADSSNPDNATQPGRLDAVGVTFGEGAGTLNFNHTSIHYDFNPELNSTAAETHRLDQLAGTTALNADSSSFSGTTRVLGGTLIVANQLGGSAAVTGGRLQVDGSFAGPIAVQQTGTLAGSGTIGGAANFANGGVLVGTQGQTLKVGGDLSLAGNSQVNVALGGSVTPALFNVAGALTLDGALNITSQGGFGLGVYRLFDYQGALTDNGIDIGTTPSGVSSSSLQLQTAINNQINLISSAGATLNFWDGGNAALHNNGVIDGGDGVWRADGSNWTAVDGVINGPFQPNPDFAIFQGASGTVIVDNSVGAIGVTGLQIASAGYRIEGDEIALQGGSESIIRVGDSSAASASMTGTINASLSGASTLVKTDFGRLVLSGNNTYSGGTDIRGGVLAVSSDANLGAATGAINLNGGALASTASFASGRALILTQQGEINVADNTEFTLSGSVTGTGELYKSGAGILILTGVNNYAGTRVESGTLVGNTHSISGSLLNNASVIFEQATDATYVGPITGRGSITKRGISELTLSGVSRHIWRIEEGTLISSAERYLGNTQIDATGTLHFEQAVDATYAGTLSGSGVFAKAGAGKLNLTGNSSAFTGHTQVQSGTLALGDQGQIGGTLTIASGATLQGSGRVGTTLLQNGATISPGNSIGTLEVAGDLTFSPGSIYRVEADPNTTASDRIDVTQTATLAGSVVHVGPDGNFASAREYTILTANSVQGRFATISSDFAFLDPTLRYSPQNVTMVLVRRASAFADAAQTKNQRATANGLDSLPADNPLHEYILTLPAGAPPSIFDSLSGELHASVASSLRGSGTRLNSLPLSHLRTRLQTQTSTLPADDMPVWVEYVGNRQTLQDDGNAAQVQQHSSGLFVGTDHAVGDGWQLGGALGYTDADLSVDDRASKADLSNYSATLFAGKSFEAGAGALNLLLGTAYTWHEIDTRRYTSVSGQSQKLIADYSASTAQLFSELGYALALSERVSIEPFAGLAWSDLRIRSFSESGGSASLSGQHSNDKQTASTLGVRTQTALSLGSVDGHLNAMLGWQHAFDEVVAHKTMAFDGSQAFTVAGAPIARNAALLELGVDIALTPTTTLGLNYSGQYGEGNREQAGILTLAWSY